MSESVFSGSIEKDHWYKIGEGKSCSLWKEILPKSIRIFSAGNDKPWKAQTVLLVVEATMETVSDIDKCVPLRNLVPFEQFQKREKHPWRSVTFSKVAGFSLQLYEKCHSSICIFPVFKLYKWHQIAQRITNNFGLQVRTFKKAMVYLLN